jgi:glycosyltransferase involved in cell wall biosynthesis
MRSIPGRRSSTSSDAAWVAARSRCECADGSVFLHAPTVAFQAPGGGENQLIQTGRHLEEQGIRVRLFSPWTDRLESARLLHLFGMSREGLDLARLARSRGVAVVISPICWYQPRAIVVLEPDVPRKIAGLAAWCLRSIAPSTPSWRRELLHLADVILPNSRAEADQLARLFGVPRARIRVVPNGVLPALGTASPNLFHERWGQDAFVLSVGRIEPRKNTLNLIRAVGRLGLSMIHIGDPVPGRHDYVRECRRAGEGFVTWLGKVDHDNPILASAYAAARVFALPSWFETPGLAALEAALAGCAVAITPFGSTREYFGAQAAYARPHRPDEIRRAIRTCWDHGPDPRLAPRIATHYLWPNVAQITAEVYDQVAR